MASSMRLFIAVPLAERVKERAASIIQGLRSSGADFKWVEPRNLHLTLSFLGETPRESIPDLEGAMKLAAQQPPFDMAFRELGAFDSLDHPRVLWLGVREGAEALKGLAERLDAILAQDGFLPEKGRGRSFAAHLTLGRMRSPRNLHRLRAALKGTALLEGLRSRVERIVLYESRLSSQGPAYTELREQPLTG